MSFFVNSDASDEMPQDITFYGVYVIFNEILGSRDIS